MSADESQTEYPDTVRDSLEQSWRELGKAVERLEEQRREWDLRAGLLWLLMLLAAFGGACIGRFIWAPALEQPHSIKPAAVEFAPCPTGGYVHADGLCLAAEEDLEFVPDLPERMLTLIDCNALPGACPEVVASLEGQGALDINVRYFPSLRIDGREVAAIVFADGKTERLCHDGKGLYTAKRCKQQPAPKMCPVGAQERRCRLAMLGH